MNSYTIALFFHVSGAIGYFIIMGTWLLSLAALRRAQRVEQVRTLTHLIGRSSPLFGISVLLLLVTGLYMAITAWGFLTGWIDLALVSLILIAPLGTAFIEPRRRTIERLAQEAPDGPLPQSLERHTHDPVLLTALQTVTILLLGIVFLMTNKPSLVGSLIVMAVALMLGLVSGVLVSRVTARKSDQSMTPRTNDMREPVR
ncbi:MAG TPA: DUF2269 family protein, partial [Ktedonobacteraceae bacterium]